MCFLFWWGDACMPANCRSLPLLLLLLPFIIVCHVYCKCTPFNTAPYKVSNEFFHTAAVLTEAIALFKPSQYTHSCVHRHGMSMQHELFPSSAA
jgi:hypothetical protein